MLDDRKIIGAIAEDHVRKYLEAQGYLFRTANWIFEHGELDLVMSEGDEIVFVEVKARRSEVAGLAEEGLTKKQQGILLRTADLYMLNTPDVEGKYWRIDFVAVSLGWHNVVKELDH